MEKLIDGIAIILAAIAIVVIGFWFYFVKVNGEKNFETNLTIVAEDMTQIESEDETLTYPIEVNYYSNKEGNGKEVFEIKFNSYTSPSMENYNGYGLQYVSPEWKWSTYDFYSGFFNHKYYDYVYGNCDYYNTGDGTSFSATNPLNNDDQLIFDINGEAFGLKCYSNWQKTANATEIENHVVYIDSFAWVHRYRSYDWQMIAQVLYQMAKSLNYGDYEIGYVDLAPYVEITKYNETTRQFENFRVGDNFKAFFKIKIHNDKNGMSSSQQSLFKMLNSDPYYFTADKNQTDYWKYITTFDLKLEHFKENETEDGTYIMLNLTKVPYLLEDEDLEINLTLNLDELYAQGKNIVGIEVYGFQGLPLKKLEIISSTERNFYILAHALDGSGLENIGKSANVNLIISETSGFEGGVYEVVC